MGMGFLFPVQFVPFSCIICAFSKNNKKEQIEQEKNKISHGFFCSYETFCSQLCYISNNE